MRTRRHDLASQDRKDGRRDGTRRAVRSGRRRRRARGHAFARFRAPRPSRPQDRVLALHRSSRGAGRSRAVRPVPPDAGAVDCGASDGSPTRPSSTPVVLCCSTAVLRRSLSDPPPQGVALDPRTPDAPLRDDADAMVALAAALAQRGFTLNVDPGDGRGPDRDRASGERRRRPRKLFAPGGRACDGRKRASFSRSCLGRGRWRAASSAAFALARQRRQFGAYRRDRRCRLRSKLKASSPISRRSPSSARSA